MDRTFQGAHFERDELPAALTQLRPHTLNRCTWEGLIRQKPPARGAAVGSWSASSGDPFAEVLVVRDEDFADSLAWLNSFFSGLSPITQWCRVISYSAAERVQQRKPAVSLGSFLGAWVGAILAECSVQAGGIQNLKDMVGSAALSTATFAAGRACAVWDGDVSFGELSRRHAELAHGLRDGARPLGSDALIPIWSVLRGRIDKNGFAESRAMEPFIGILAGICAEIYNLDPAEVVERTARKATEYFDLPLLEQCAIGPQVARVRALDRLGEQFSTGPFSPAIDALLGLAASFIDPGSAVAPELLRRHARQSPAAPIWQGVFAGAMQPFRVMTEQGGLGRLVAKSLTASVDLNDRPACDVAYEELVRWITPGRSIKVDLRSMSARVLSVELLTGVTCAFPFGRAEGMTSVLPTSPLPESTRAKHDRQKAGSRAPQDLEGLVMDLQRRMEIIEEQMRATTQGALGFEDSRDVKNRRKPK